MGERKGFYAESVGGFDGRSSGTVALSLPFVDSAAFIHGAMDDRSGRLCAILCYLLTMTSIGTITSFTCGVKGAFLKISEIVHGCSMRIFSLVYCSLTGTSVICKHAIYRTSTYNS